METTEYTQRLEPGQEQEQEHEQEHEQEGENTAATASYSFVQRRSTNQRVSRDQESCAKLRVVQFLKREKSGFRTRR